MHILILTRQFFRVTKYLFGKEFDTTVKITLEFSLEKLTDDVKIKQKNVTNKKVELLILLTSCLSRNVSSHSLQIGTFRRTAKNLRFEHF